MKNRESTPERSNLRKTSLLRLASLGLCLLLAPACASSGEEDARGAPGNEQTQAVAGVFGRSAETDASVAVASQPVSVYFQDIVDTVPQSVKDELKDAKASIEDIMKAKDYASAAFAAAQALGIFDTPEPAATLSQVRAALDQLGASLDWKINSVGINEIYREIKASMDAAVRCGNSRDCATNNPAWTQSDHAAAALYGFTDDAMIYFQRYNNPAVVKGDWQYHISERAAVSAQNYVYDWRYAMPYYLNFLKDRLAIMLAMDPAFGTSTTTFDNELRTHAVTLQKHYDKMKSGVKCAVEMPAYGCDWTGNGNDGPANWECAGVDVYVYCADIYTGSYASGYLGAWGMDVTASQFSAEVEVTRQQVYNAMPLVEMERVITSLNYFLDKLHGYTIPNDFNHDGFADILWHQPGSGKIAVWTLDGDNSVPGSYELASTAAASSGWEIKGSGDFNHDGYNDILWHKPSTGQVHVWLLDGDATLAPGSWVFNATRGGLDGWEIKGTGDFNHDGYVDILWHHLASGQVGIWLLDGDSTILDDSWRLNLTAKGSSGWEIAGTGDFNHDGYVDILWRHRGQGLVHVWLLHGGTTVTGSWVYNATSTGSMGWEIAGVGDYNRDGFADILWHNASSGLVHTWLLHGDNTVPSSWVFDATASGASGWDIVPNVRSLKEKDLNRDSQADIVLRNPTSGIVRAWQLDGDNTVGSAWDFNTTAAASSGWKLVGMGDFNRDGYTDLLWYHPASGQVHVWLLDGDSTIAAGSWVFDMTANTAEGWEIRGVGDFNRDGFVDILWHRPSTSMVHVWLLDGDSTVAGGFTFDAQGGGVDGWEIAGAGDFNRDGYTDILWHQVNTGSVGAWLLDGDNTVPTSWIFNTKTDANGWKVAGSVVGTGDFNHDGTTDILLNSPLYGYAAVWLLDGDETISGSWQFTSSAKDWEITSR